MSRIRPIAVAAARLTLKSAIAIFGILILRILLDGLLNGQWHVDWLELFKTVGEFTAGWVVFVYLLIWFYHRAYAPANEILMQVPSQINDNVPLFSGFVAMEYYALICNRTFVVFITPEGLYGWKARGPVTAEDPMYFEPFANILEDPSLMQDREAIRKLSDLKGGFFISRSEIVSADVIHGRKWGMSRIPHSGRIKVRLSSGKARDFILLGSFSPESIQQRILGS